MKGKILVIEDDLDWQTNLKEFLDDHGYYVEVVSTIEQAVEKVKGRMYHFITVDMQLNEMTTTSSEFEGWTVLNIMKRLGINQRTPAMVITGFDEEYLNQKDKNRIKSLFFMSKADFDKESFLETIDRAVDQVNLHFHDDHRDI